MSYPYHHVRTEDGRESLTVFMPEGSPVVATADHPRFAELLEGAQSNISANELRDLSDLSVAVARKFEALSERVSVAGGVVYFDGDEVDSTITQQIKRCLDDPSVGDWKPLVLFMENVAANPNEHSRTQLFDWLRDRAFTITNNGCFIAYKGVEDRDVSDGDDSYPYQSGSRGKAIVNGEEFDGYIPNGPGATVEMPRSDVQHDPTTGCSTGLHVGTYAYAEDYAGAALLTVLVNPRDVVSVPTDSNAEKMRVCRYVVQDDEATSPDESPAIEEAKPRRLYVANPALFSNNVYFADTGETRKAQDGEYYRIGDSVNQVCGDGNDWRPARPILEPTTPRHGDEKVDEDGSVWFWCACPDEDAEWWPAEGETQDEFLSGHEECFA